MPKTLLHVFFGWSLGCCWLATGEGETGSWNFVDVQSVVCPNGQGWFAMNLTAQWAGLPNIVSVFRTSYSAVTLRFHIVDHTGKLVVDQSTGVTLRAITSGPTPAGIPPPVPPPLSTGIPPMPTVPPLPSLGPPRRLSSRRRSFSSSPRRRSISYSSPRRRSYSPPRRRTISLSVPRRRAALPSIPGAGSPRRRLVPSPGPSNLLSPRRRVAPASGSVAGSPRRRLVPSSSPSTLISPRRRVGGMQQRRRGIGPSPGVGGMRRRQFGPTGSPRRRTGYQPAYAQPQAYYQPGAGYYGYSNPALLAHNFGGRPPLHAPYGYTGPHAYSGYSGGSVAMALAGGLFAGVAGSYLYHHWGLPDFRRMSCHSGMRSSWRGNCNECMSTFSSGCVAQVQPSFDVARDDLMQTGFEPSGFVQPFILNITGITGQDYLPGSVCPPLGWTPEANLTWKPPAAGEGLFFALTALSRQGPSVHHNPGPNAMPNLHGNAGPNVMPNFHGNPGPNMPMVDGRRPSSTGDHWDMVGSFAFIAVLLFGCVVCAAIMMGSRMKQMMSSGSRGFDWSDSDSDGSSVASQAHLQTQPYARPYQAQQYNRAPLVHPQ